MTLHSETSSAHPTVLTAARPAPSIRLLRSRTLRGSNVYHVSTVLHQPVDLGALAGMHTGEAGSAFAARFVDRFGMLEPFAHDARIGERFLARLRGPLGVPLEEALFESILAVERSVLFEMRRLDPPEYAEILPGESDGKFHFVWETDLPPISRAAARIAAGGLRDLLARGADPPGVEGGEGFEAALSALRQRASRRRWPTTAGVVAFAAKRRRVPCTPLGESYLLLGEGVAQQVVHATVEMGRAGANRYGDKRRTNRRLAEANLPVPSQREAMSRENVLAAAKDLGYPLVVKPVHRHCASGVTVAIDTLSGALAAYERARLYGPRVLIERFVAGRTYRLLVIGGRVVGALRFDVPRIVGDGRRTVEELIHALNQDPNRDDVRLSRVELDDEVAASLGRHGCRLATVLEDGKRLEVRSVASASLGAVHTDVTDTVHEQCAALAVSAASRLGLDVAGVDLVSMNVAQPPSDTHLRILDVTPRPDLLRHTFPAVGRVREVGTALLDLIFPPGTTARIPTAVVVGRRGTSLVARELDWILRAAGRIVGLSTRNRASINGVRIELGSTGRLDRPEVLLKDPRVDTLVMATSPRRIVRRGLRVDYCTAGALLDSDADGDGDLCTLALKVIGRATAGALVVDAESPAALTALRAIASERLILLSSRRRTLLIRRHLAAGGTALQRAPGNGRECIEILRGSELVSAVPITVADHAATGDRELRARAHMFAVALAFGLGLSGAAISTAVKRRMHLTT